MECEGQTLSALIRAVAQGLSSLGKYNNNDSDGHSHSQPATTNNDNDSTRARASLEKARARMFCQARVTSLLQILSVNIAQVGRYTQPTNLAPRPLLLSINTPLSIPSQHTLIPFQVTQVGRYTHLCLHIPPLQFSKGTAPSQHPPPLLCITPTQFSKGTAPSEAAGALSEEDKGLLKQLLLDIIDGQGPGLAPAPGPGLARGPGLGQGNVASAALQVFSVGFKLLYATSSERLQLLARFVSLHAEDRLSPQVSNNNNSNNNNSNNYNAPRLPSFAWGVD